MVGFFETKVWILLKPLKFQRSKVAVKNDWESNISQNVQKFGCLKKHMGFPKKKFNFFEIAKGKYCPVKSDWKNKISRKVQNLLFSSEVFGFFEKSPAFFQVFQKFENLLQNATVIRNFLKVLKIWV